jgi:hypothetical protein
MGDMVVSSQFELIRTVLEDSIRKITLTVTWSHANEKQSLVVTYYVTDPSAVNQTVPGSGAADPGAGGGGAGGGGAGGGGAGGEAGGGRGGGEAGGGRGGGRGGAQGGGRLPSRQDRGGAR